jgi:hypothetical protein
MSILPKCVLCTDHKKEFETRKAAVQALAEFFTPLYKILKIDIECLLPAYLALYDTLNDDDEEIRDLGAKAVSSILEKQLAPLPAQNDFIVFMSNKYSRSTLWAWNIICRISGNNNQIFERNQAKLHPAKGAFRKALTRNNALFAEEKQNLFIDEVRETKQWISAFDNMGLDHSNGWHIDIMGRALDTNDASTIPQSALTTWTLEGLAEISKIIWVEDGSLGYISDPAVFASSVRVILAANALIKRARCQAPVHQDITHHLGELLRRSDELRVHPMLLSEINEDPALEKAMLAYDIRPSLLKSKSLVNKTQQ